MNPVHTTPRAAACAALLWMLACPARAALDAPAQVRLQALGAAPSLAGELIYQGRTFALDASGPEPLFHYERRVLVTPLALIATHLTREPTQRLVIAEEAQYSPGYRLQRFSAYNLQLGYSGVAQLSPDGRRVRYSVNDKGVASTAEESIEHPAVSGPSLFGFILAHAAELATGRTVPVRFIVLKDKRSYGLDIRQESATPEQVVYSISASQWWLRPFLASMRLVVDADRRSIVRYEGRVPPMRTVTGTLADLDARVEYTPVAAAYR
ncbi:MAG: hypothetical protein ACT4NV_09385 [Rhodoferax sp.]